MSATRDPKRAGVLPATQHNVLTGAGWAALIFPQLVGLGYCGLIGVIAVFGGFFDPDVGFDWLILTYVATAITSAIPGLVAIGAVGVPLSLVASRLTRNTSSTAVNVAAQTVAGIIGGGILVGMFLLATDTHDDNALLGIPPIVAAGFSAALGWRIALSSARRASRKAPTIDEDVEDAAGSSS